MSEERHQPVSGQAQQDGRQEYTFEGSQCYRVHPNHFINKHDQTHLCPTNQAWGWQTIGFLKRSITEGDSTTSYRLPSSMFIVQVYNLLHRSIHSSYIDWSSLHGPEWSRSCLHSRLDASLPLSSWSILSHSQTTVLPPSSMTRSSSPDIKVIAVICFQASTSNTSLPRDGHGHTINNKDLCWRRDS